MGLDLGYGSTMRWGSALQGPRVELRALQVDDWDGWRAVRIRSRDWLERWEPLGEPGAPDPALDRDAFRARCNAWDRQRQFDLSYGFGIFVRRGGGFVGEVSLGSVQRGPFQSAFGGYWIDAGPAGTGLVPEGVAVVSRFAFEELALHRVEAASVPRNDRSLRVAAKLGLRREGTSERFLQIQGVWEDHARFAITAEEWEERHVEFERDFLSRRRRERAS